MGHRKDLMLENLRAPNGKRCQRIPKRPTRKRPRRRRRRTKRPWIWLSETRDAIAKEAGSSKGSDVGKLAGTKWKAMSANSKAPYEKKATEQKAAYEIAMEQFKAAGGVVGK